MREVLKNRILAALSDAEFARLKSFLEPVSLASGAHLHAPGDAPWFVYFPENCVHSCQVHMEDGRSAEVAMIGFEGVADILAFIPSRPAIYSLNVLIGGDALRVRKDHLEREIPRLEKLQQLLSSYTAAFVTQLAQRSACANFHLLEQRLAVWLLLLSDHVGGAVMRITQEQTAHYLGVRRAGVTVAALQMQAAGAINYRRGRLRIDNRESLKEFACECYETLALAQRDRTRVVRLENTALIKEHNSSNPIPADQVISGRVWSTGGGSHRRLLTRNTL